MDFVISLGIGASGMDFGFRRGVGFFFCVSGPLFTCGLDKLNGFYHYRYAPYEDEQV